MILVGNSGHAKLSFQPHNVSPRPDQANDTPPRYSLHTSPRPRRLSFRGQPPSYEDLIRDVSVQGWDAPPKYHPGMILPEVFEDEDGGFEIELSHDSALPSEGSPKTGVARSLIAKLRCARWGCWERMLYNMFRRLRTKFQRAESRVAKNDSVESKK